MSHVAAQETKAGEPLYLDINCLQKAAEMKGFELVHTNEYHWYQRHVGDYPIPAGMTKEELGKNAKFVLRVNAENRAKFERVYGGKPYEIGFVEDPNNPGAYTPIYDFYRGGLGVDDLLGSPVRENGKIKLLCPELKQTYDMVCDASGASESLDAIKFLTRKQVSEQRAQLAQEFPQLFQQVPELLEPSEDEKTWLAFANTEARLGVK